MTTRSAQAGKLEFTRRVTLTTGIIADGTHADVDAVADLVWAGGVARPLGVSFDGAPLDANLGILGAWVSDPVLGVVTVRFTAAGGATASVAQKLAIFAVD